MTLAKISTAVGAEVVVVGASVVVVVVDVASDPTLTNNGPNGKGGVSFVSSVIESWSFTSDVVVVAAVVSKGINDVVTGGVFSA